MRDLATLHPLMTVVSTGYYSSLLRFLYHICVQEHPTWKEKKLHLESLPREQMLLQEWRLNIMYTFDRCIMLLLITKRLQVESLIELEEVVSPSDLYAQIWLSNIWTRTGAQSGYGLYQISILLDT